MGLGSKLVSHLRERVKAVLENVVADDVVINTSWGIVAITSSFFKGSDEQRPRE